MRTRPLVEICVVTLAGAMAAERGGADRIELCENLPLGGVTPSSELMRAVRAQIHIPIFAMIRPRAGDFLYSEKEFAQMIRDIDTAKRFGMDGAVLGLLDAEKHIDVKRTTELVKLALPLPVTFHRAFDDAVNLVDALEDVILTGAIRVLTSGGTTSAEDGIGKIVELVGASRGRITIMPGGGISAANIERILIATQAQEFHSGLSSTLPYSRTDYATFEAEVRKMADMLKKYPNGKRRASTLD